MISKSQFRHDHLRLMWLLSKYFKLSRFEFSRRLHTNFRILRTFPNKIIILNYDEDIISTITAVIFEISSESIYDLVKSNASNHVCRVLASWTDLRTMHRNFEYWKLLHCGRERSDISFWNKAISFWCSWTNIRNLSWRLTLELHQVFVDCFCTDLFSKICLWGKRCFASFTCTL